ncbi:UNVERIFIED_CONTAM: hypothetical protein HDU68_011813 [Siphonaria sp. JEL0065]|nr:hypothetical protein HDU68_011813 [Siphonaria sp. JEL0065]
MSSPLFTLASSLLLSSVVYSAAIGDACAATGSAACSLSADVPGAGAIVQCVGGTLILLENCNDAPNNACTLISGSPFCVAGKGILGAVDAAPVTPVVPPTITAPSVPPVTAGNPPLVTGTTQAAPAAPTTSTCTGITYSIKSGDTCTTIATANGATAGDLVVLNQDICGGTNQNNLQVGATLCIVPGASATVGPTITADALNTAAYLAAQPCTGHVDIVMSGATCSTIAAKYGVTLAALMAVTIPGQCAKLEAADAICVPGAAGTQVGTTASTVISARR